MVRSSPRISPRKRRKPFARSAGHSFRTRLHLEILEDRLVLSTTAVDFSVVDYETWRQQEFTIDAIDVTETSLDLADGEDVQAANAFANELIGLDHVFAEYSYRGTGYSVAVIDTGIDYNHSAFAGRYIGGYDFANDDSDPYDDNGHGTHVAGLIGSGDSTYTGVAPDVNLIALKVLSATGSGTFGDVEDALQWVIQNQSTYNIVAVNMSLGAGNYASNPYTFLEDEFASLLSQGVFIAAASGNSYYSVNSVEGLGYPAISPQTVSVGAVWAGNFGSVSWASGGRDYSTAADRVTSFTQRSSDLDIMAPGAMLTNAKAGGGWVTMAGTSMATPVVAGAAAIIHQAMDATGQGHLANQDYILSIMQSTGVQIYDGDDEDDNVTNSNRYYQRLDLAAALDTIGQPENQAPILLPIANQTMSYDQDVITVTLIATDADGDILTYTASAFTADNRDDSIQISIAENVLTIDPPEGYTGEFRVDVTVTDGLATASQSFEVSVEIPTTDPPPSSAPTPPPPVRRQNYFAVASDAGVSSHIRVYDAQTGVVRFDILPYDPAFVGGVRVATGDVNGDGVEDFISVPGPSGGPHIKVYDGKTGTEIRSFMAYAPDVTNGLFVTTGDINGDGFADIITGVDVGAGPHVRVFSGADGTVLRDFFAYDPAFTGGVRVASGDINGDGFDDIITVAGPTGGPHVRAYNAVDNTILREFMAYDPAVTTGLWVAAGDVNGDGKADIITGAGPGGGPHVKVFDGHNGATRFSFFAYQVTFTGGVRVTSTDANGDGKADIVTAGGPGGQPIVRILSGDSAAEFYSILIFAPPYFEGLFAG